MVAVTCGTQKTLLILRVEQLRAQIGDQKVLLGLSGGVDSSVVAALLTPCDWRSIDLRIRR